jgi:hypothetical protein
VAYFSKTLSKADRNYCMIQRELLAIVKTMEHIHKYLYGQTSLALPTNPDQREVTQAAVIMGRPVQSHTQVNDMVCGIQWHPREKVMIVNLDLWAT